MYGEANARHEVIRSQIAGLGPAGDAENCRNCSVYNWTLGHLIPVPGEIGATDGDLEEQYVLARYRIWIDEAQYKRLVAYIDERKAGKVQWHAMFNSCVMFGRDVAAFLGLNVPPMFDFSRRFIPYPRTAVEALRDANGGEKDEAPLKDAPGTLPAEVATKAHTKREPPSRTAAVRTSTPASETEGARSLAAPSKHTANDRDADGHESLQFASSPDQIAGPTASRAAGWRDCSFLTGCHSIESGSGRRRRPCVGSPCRSAHRARPRVRPNGAPFQGSRAIARLRAPESCIRAPVQSPAQPEPAPHWRPPDIR